MRPSWMPVPAALLAQTVHAVVAEYRKLDAAPAPEPAPQELSCTQARIETRWQPHQDTPAAARAATTGFGKP